MSVPGTDMAQFSEELRVTSVGDARSDPAASVRGLEQIKDVFWQLPHQEVDMLCLYYLYGKEQKEIAGIFGVSQGDVSYRIRRCVERIKFLLEMPRIPESEMREILSRYLPDEMVHICLGVFRTTSQSAVAKSLGSYQGHVRYRLVRALKVLREFGGEDTEAILRFFEGLSRSNYNALRSLDVAPMWKGNDRLGRT